MALAGAVLGLACATPAAQAGDPFFGTFTTDFSDPQPVLDQALAAQAATGAGTLREHVHWDRVERAPGRFDWAELDQLVGRAADHGLTVLPVLITTPSFYSTRPAGVTTDGWPPRDPGSISRFAYEVAHRYGRLGSFWGCVLPGLACKRPYRPIRAWQVWNEPDYPAWWRTGPDPAAYTRLLRQASLGLRLGDPLAEVVLGGVSLGALANGYLDRLYANGARLWFDTLALHPYAADVPGIVAHVQRARQIAAARGDRSVPVRVTEYGFATGGVREWVTDEACQASLLHAATRELSARRAELRLRGVVQFQWQDRVGASWPHFMGLLRPDGTAKPALGAFREAVAGRAAPAGLPAPESCANRRKAPVSAAPPESATSPPDDPAEVGLPRATVRRAR